MCFLVIHEHALYKQVFLIELNIQANHRDKITG